MGLSGRFMRVRGGPHMTDRYHEGNGPYSDHETRKALLVLGPNDIVEIDGYGEMEVIDREEPYFGVELTVGNDDVSYRIVPAGFANDPELWRVDTDEDGFIIGFEFVDNVTLEVSEVGKSLRCPICNEVLQNEMERRLALIGQYCPHEGVQT